MASPAVEPVCHELLAGHERDIGQPAPVELFFLNVVVHCCDVASVWRWQPERHNMVSQSPDWRGENGHYGSSYERRKPGAMVVAQERIFCLLALELGVCDVSPVAEIGALGHLVRRALRSRNLLDISAELLVLLALVRTACYCILPPRAIR
jgi:hypothetical protein